MQVCVLLVVVMAALVSVEAAPREKRQIIGGLLGELLGIKTKNWQYKQMSVSLTVIVNNYRQQQVLLSRQ